MPSDRRLLLVHAHPDDESIANGATMARYAAEGAAVTLVTCTLGEEGEILVPELTGLAADYADQLGGYRIHELASACAALGVGDHRYLGGAGRHRDSGMMAHQANDKPGTFWRTDLDAAAAQLVPIVREVRPQVLITYDELGGYGHPDHIQAQRVAMRGADLAGDPAFQSDTPAWTIPKVYWTVIPRAGFPEAGGLPYFVPDCEVSAVVDGSAYLPTKLTAMAAHATQLTVDGTRFALSNGIWREMDGVEYYRLVRGTAGPVDPGTCKESDLFAGIEAAA